MLVLDPHSDASDLKPDMTADSISVARIALFSLFIRLQYRGGVADNCMVVVVRYVAYSAFASVE